MIWGCGLTSGVGLTTASGRTTLLVGADVGPPKGAQPPPLLPREQAPGGREARVAVGDAAKSMGTPCTGRRTSPPMTLAVHCRCEAPSAGAASMCGRRSPASGSQSAQSVGKHPVGYTQHMIEVREADEYRRWSEGL